MEYSTWGIIINILAGAIAALGWTLQKYGHNKTQESGIPHYRNTIWWVGILLTFVSLVLYLFSATLANQSTLGVLEPTGIFMCIVAARVLLKEKLTKLKMIGAGLFIPGVILTLL